MNGAPTASPDNALSGSGADPSPAAGNPRMGVKMPTAKMHSKTFALLREVMPFDTTEQDRDGKRRAFEMELCAAIGTPGLTSHKQITYETGRLLIDALEGLKDGTYTWAPASENGPGRLLRTETGEPIDFGEPFE